MDKLKVHIWHLMFWEFKNKKQLRKFVVFITAKFETVFSKFRSDDSSLRDEPSSGPSSDLDQDALRELVECNSHKNTREFALDLNTSQSVGTWKK